MPARTPSDSPIINEDADRRLGRIILRHGLLLMALLILTPFALAPVNLPSSPLYPYHRWLDTLSILIVMLPFFVGIQRLFAARLRIGRDLVEKRRWREAVAALDPFAGPTQRFLDGTGEAHYLLAVAYAGAGDRGRADAARAFVLRHRPGPWADKLQGTTGTPEQRPRPVSSKRRRRF